MSKSTVQKTSEISSIKESNTTASEQFVVLYSPESYEQIPASELSSMNPAAGGEGNTESKTVDISSDVKGEGYVEVKLTVSETLTLRAKSLPKDVTVDTDPKTGEVILAGDADAIRDVLSKLHVTTHQTNGFEKTIDIGASLDVANVVSVQSPTPYVQKEFLKGLGKKAKTSSTSDEITTDIETITGNSTVPSGNETLLNNFGEEDVSSVKVSDKSTSRNKKSVEDQKEKIVLRSEKEQTKDKKEKVEKQNDDRDEVEVVTQARDTNNDTNGNTGGGTTVSNTAPIIDEGISNQSVVENTAFTFVVPTDAFSDADGDSLTLTATLDGGGSLPSWLSFDGSEFTGTPANDAVGTITVEVTASDGNGGAISNDFDIQVTAAPVPGETITGTNNVDTLVGKDGDDSIIGKNSDDSIEGNGGHDTLRGDNHNDTISGGDGNDSILGGNHNDSLLGDAGNDTLSGGNHHDTLIGGDGDDVLSGDNNNDSIVGGDGDDTLIGGRHNDTLEGGAGDDQFNVSGTNQGTDSFDGGDGIDTLLGSSGDDRITGQITNIEVIDGGDGQDTLQGSSSADSIDFSTTTVTSIEEISLSNGNDTFIGGSGDESVRGGNHNDSLVGNAGNDTLVGDNNHDTLIGGEGDDSLSGGNHNDSLVGGKGNDTLSGGSHHDVLEGGDGDDVLSGDNNNDTISGGAGNDTITGGRHNDVLEGGDGDDQFNVSGTNQGTDSYDGGDGDDTLLGSSGDDRITGQITNIENIDGGDGQDTLRLGNSADNLDLGVVAVSNIEEIQLMNGNDTFVGSSEDEVVLGGNHHDSIDGGAGDDSLVGDNNNDTLIGGEGNDTLTGGRHNDSLLGGDGDDQFNISGTNQGTDRIDGGDGNDAIVGSSGNDRMTFAELKDVESIDGGAGQDTLQFGNGADNLDFSGIVLTSIEEIQLRNGHDTFVGSSADDSVKGGKHNDSIDGGEGNDTLVGENNHDTLQGGTGNDSLDGGKHNDSLLGGEGDDTLIGGLGRDTLVGGDGDDIFRFEDTAESSGANAAFIADFTQGDDTIDVTGLGFSGINAGSATGNKLGQSYDSNSNTTTVSNVDGDFVIELLGDVDLTKADFDGFSGGGGGSVICTELWRQGLMPDHVYEADRLFGYQVAMHSPYALMGYLHWAPSVVSAMQKSKLLTYMIYPFAMCWAKEMAYQTDRVEKGSLLGRIVMKFGVPFCEMIGRRKWANTPTESMSS